MPSKYVPWIVLQVSTSTRTYRGSLRPPKWPSKAKNCQKRRFFWSRPKIVIFWPFLAFEGRLGGLKDPLEVRVEDETCRTIHGTHLEGILSPKNWTWSLVNSKRKIPLWGEWRNRFYQISFAIKCEKSGRSKAKPTAFKFLLVPRLSVVLVQVTDTSLLD